MLLFVWSSRKKRKKLVIKIRSTGYGDGEGRHDKGHRERLGLMGLSCVLQVYPCQIQESEV